MKLTISKSNFEIVLSNLQTFLDKKDFSQITSHIYLEVVDSKLLLRATDFELYIESKIDIINKESDGNATANGRELLDKIRKLKDGDILLETKNGILSITQNTAEHELDMFEASEFPKLPDFEGSSKINIESSKFINSIHKANPAIDTGSSSKQEYKGILLDIKDYSLNFVATDSRRLAIIKYETQSIENFSIIIPKRAVIEILKLFYDDIEIFYNQTQLMVKNANYTFFTKLINGKFSDYEKIIPKEFKHQAKLPKNQMVDKIKMVNSYEKIKIIFKNDLINFESISENTKKVSRDKLSIETGLKEEIILGVNSKYILDFLSQIESSEFEIMLNEPNQPFVLKDGNFLTIIMPIIF